MSSRSRKVQFGPFEFDLSNGELLKYGRRVRFQEQPARVLRILISRPGELVTREELRDELWPADVFTDYEHGIHRAVNRIRVTLGDTAAKPRFVETQAGRGYRFIAPISALANGPPDHANTSDDFRPNALPSSTDGVNAAQKPSRWPFRISWFGTAAAAILLIVSVGLSLSRRHTTSIALHPKDFVLVRESHWRGGPGSNTRFRFPKRA